eukprot:4339238-Amphidinium_carterae.1
MSVCKRPFLNDTYWTRFHQNTLHNKLVKAQVDNNPRNPGTSITARVLVVPSLGEVSFASLLRHFIASW